VEGAKSELVWMKGKGRINRRFLRRRRVTRPRKLQKTSFRQCLDLGEQTNCESLLVLNFRLSSPSLSSFLTTLFTLLPHSSTSFHSQQWPAPRYVLVVLGLAASACLSS
jgi:hypothetical protein